MNADRQTELIESTYAAGQSRMRANVLEALNKLPYSPELQAAFKAVIALPVTPFNK